ncbi:hypothetical protein Asulf_01676 [Archaeoglobus sulfaticallidus PM70-1]|uniref:Uncharacterized protein n=1 Tax=Archaeoglobus sulfaticallidus PM70-1 TaxID=387631 RepID=N0BDE2_9EURY|nr:hypothetical protein [Archaeoglobus sulfaticallidus]AGK61649.1 hypothetical protein Asulf_01676 [Archaeoglobus sulfaticallidus PM70-1]
MGNCTDVEAAKVCVKKVWFKTFKLLDRYSGVAEDNLTYIVLEVYLQNNGNKTIYQRMTSLPQTVMKILCYDHMIHLFEDAYQIDDLERGKSISGK